MTLFEEYVETIINKNSEKTSVLAYMQDLERVGVTKETVPQIYGPSKFLAVFSQFEDDILDALYEEMESDGEYNPAKLFGKRWDVKDPLARYIDNQGLLVKWAFEAVATKMHVDGVL